MQRKKLFSAAIALVLIAFLTTSSVSRKPNSKPEPVTITAVYNFLTFPNVSGTFTTGGAWSISGTSTMDITPENNNTHADCEVRLYPSGGGSISIHQECNLIAGVGKWKITGGTGIYEDLKGKGILTMPPNTEAMSGVIHWEK